MGNLVIRKRLGLVGASMLIIFDFLLYSFFPSLKVLSVSGRGQLLVFAFGVVILTLAILSIYVIAKDRFSEISYTASFSVLAFLFFWAIPIPFGGWMFFFLFLGTALLSASRFAKDQHIDWALEFWNSFQAGHHTHTGSPLNPDSINIAESKSSNVRSFQKWISVSWHYLLKYHAGIESNFKLKRGIGVAGSIILFFGAFAPLIRAPVIGSVSYIGRGTGDGLIIIAISALALFFVLKNKFNYVLYCGYASLILLTLTFFSFQSRLSRANDDMQRDLADNPFRGFAEVAIDSVQMEWGWAVLIIGTGLLIASAKLEK